METIKVPKVPRPKGSGYCWKSGGPLGGYCTLPKGHPGPHTWQRKDNR